VCQVKYSRELDLSYLEGIQETLPCACPSLRCGGANVSLKKKVCPSNLQEFDMTFLNSPGLFELAFLALYGNFNGGLKRKFLSNRVKYPFS